MDSTPASAAPPASESSTGKQTERIQGKGREQGYKKKAVCRFYATKNGCRAGDGCPYAHVEEQAIEAGPSKAPQPRAKVARSQSAQQPQRTYQAPAVDSSRVVQRPRPQSEDPRTFQLGQIQRRFKPEVFENDDASTMTFKMPPSDPDFPYEIEALECSLLVPKSYPETEKPSLRVLNKDIPRGFQINIERGFDIILSTAPEATLLGVMNRLDRQLESILTGEMAETIKIIAHRGAPPASNTAQKANEGEIAVQTATTTKLLQPPLPTFSSQQRWDAQAKRQTNVRQLEARFGRLQSFHKAPDGFSYTLPLDSPKRSAWPAPLQNIRSFTLLLPELYPLEPSTIMLGNDSAEARNVEQAFNARSAAGLDATLTQQVNYLTQHVKDFATEAPLPVPEKAVKSTEPATTVPTAEETSHTPLQAKPLADEDDRSHIKVIPRPPEWAAGGEQGGSDSDSEDYSYDSGDETEDSVHTDNGTQPASAPAERGILLSFPHLELHGIELMEVTTLNITVKCERCKDTTDIERLRNNAQGDASGMREHSCKKCANPLAVGFRADLIHGNSVRAGYLDLDGCTVIDMLPSNFIPTCAECSTSHPAPGVVSVRGESTMAICRECHKRMSFKIPEVKFLQVSAAAIRASRAPGRKKPKKNLGIVAGTELPRRGRCTHYGKSYRWFRFSCCSKVFPCDKCHDEATDHPNEHANRMLCGFCSREQNYRPEDCGVCHSLLIGKRGHGFWEGGKGTRDKARMSRKDPRKYKRRPGTVKKT